MIDSHVHGDEKQGSKIVMRKLWPIDFVIKKWQSNVMVTSGYLSSLKSDKKGPRDKKESVRS